MKVSSWLPCLCAILLAHLYAMSLAGADIERPDNKLGFADEAGRLRLWMDDGVTIETGIKGLELPILFQFTSGAVHPSDGCLGLNWWFPIFESYVVAESERVTQMTTPWGQSYSLWKNREGKFQTPDGDWTGVVESDDRFVVNGREGAVLEFRKGRLWQFGFTEGVKYQLVRRSGDERVTSVRRGPGNDVLIASYDERGYLTHLTCNDDKKFVFEYSKAPRLLYLDGNPVVQSLAVSASSITLNNTQKTSLERILDSDGEQLQIKRLVREGGAWSDKWAGKMNWEGKSGLLKTDGEWEYETSYPYPEAPYPKLSRRRIGAKNTHGESYFWNTKTFVEERMYDNGLILNRHFVGTSGPAYCKISKVTAQSVGDSHPQTIFQCSFDAAGQPIRILRTTEWWPRILSGGPHIPSAQLYAELFGSGQTTSGEKTRELSQVLTEEGKTMAEKLPDGSTKLTTSAKNGRTIIKILDGNNNIKSMYVR
jgi:hypothetical protein